MLKKFFACVLAMTFLLVAVGCGNETDSAETESSGIKRILFIGNSHAKDTYAALPELFKAEGYNGYTFGLAYIGSTVLADHAALIANNGARYVYYLSEDQAGYTTPNGREDNNRYIMATLGSIIQDKEWDLIILLLCMGDIFEGDNGDAVSRQTIVNYIRSIRPNAKIGTECSWLSPYADDISTVNDTSSYNKRMALYNRYGTTDAEHFAPQCTVMKNYILNDPVYSMNFAIGTAVFYANKVLGVPSGNVKNDATCLYRDDVHMSIYGRAIIAYSFFAQFTGKEIKKVNLNAVSAFVADGAWYNKENIPALTDDQKSVIIQTANYTFNHPWVVPTAE